MLQREFMGIFDIKPDKRVSAASSTKKASAKKASSTGADRLLPMDRTYRALSLVREIRPGKCLGAVILAIFPIFGSQRAVETRTRIEGEAFAPPAVPRNHK
jgi:hypothetical protein